MQDTALLEKVGQLCEERDALGLKGLVGGLEAVVINTHEADLAVAAQELLNNTGLGYAGAFQGPGFRCCLLRQEGSADFILQSRTDQTSPFSINGGPKSAVKPMARLETFVFQCRDLRNFVTLQKERGVRFMTDWPLLGDGYSFIQTEPSLYTGNSLGFIQKDRAVVDYRPAGAMPLNWNLVKPGHPHLDNIFELDHTATRVHADERNDAILEFMGLTGYNFEFAIYVESLNSITSVARLSGDDYSAVFTSGINPFVSLEKSGPTESFIHNYGLRVHHMAFRTEQIEETYAGLVKQGQGFLTPLVGGPSEGLHQAFSAASPHTYLVNEYIQRYDGFDGFFTKSNVTVLTRATEKQ